MRVRNWNFYCDKKEKGDIRNRFWEIAFLWIAIGFLWLSFFHIVREGYPQILTDSFKTGFLEILKNPKLLQEGFLSIAEVYIRDWNAYYGTNYIVIDATGNYMPQTFFIIAVAGWLVVWGNAHLLRKRIFYAFFPMAALIMQLLVGHSPKENGILYLFIGTVLLLSIEQREAVQIFARKGRRNYQLEVIFTKVMAFALSVVSLYTAGILFKNPIADWQEKKQDVLAWQENLNIPSSIEEFFRGWDFQFSTENLNNRTPQYTGKLILEVEAEYTPEMNLYLKGFYGTEYRNGTWDRDDSIFLEACAKNGYDEAEMAQFVSRMPFVILEQSEVVSSMSSESVEEGGVNKQNQYVISYKKNIGNTAYVPYVFDYKTLDEEYSFFGDYLLKKSMTDTSVSVTGFMRGNMTSVIWNMYALTGTDSIERRKWYNQVAAMYNDVPSDMEVISEAAEIIRERINGILGNAEWIEVWEGSNLNGISKQQEAEMEQAMNDNLYRQTLASFVANYLSETMSYNLVLDNLPFGEDPITFAMTKSYEGYCMHFASSATLLLRELGVPARYASGYVVRPSDFVWVEETKNYHANVQDYHAHAWVEIYLDYMGWVPFEVTPGYDSSNGLLPTQQRPQESENEELNSETETQQTETVNETENPMESESEEQQSENNTQGLETEQENSETEQISQDVGKSGGISGIERWFSDKFAQVVDFIAKNLRAILWIVSGALVLAVSVFAGKRMHVYYVNVLEMEIKQKQTRKAVKRINRRIYRYLWLHGLKAIGKENVLKAGLYRRTLSDMEYGMLLEETFSAVSKEDWRTYMEIVKKMYYSKQEITEDEMMHCYRCYKKI